MFNKFIRKYFIQQYQIVGQSLSDQCQQQDFWLNYMLRKGKNTQFGHDHQFRHIQHANDFRKQVPLRTYNDIKKYIYRQKDGKPDELWPGIIRWFAKSSGTSSDKSKFIPVSDEMLIYNHYRGGKDMLSIYCNNNPQTSFFKGRSLTLGGSYNKNYNRGSEIITGDLSALLMLNLPFWAEYQRVPDLHTALLDDWEVKFDAIARQVVNKNVTSLSGVPSWMLLLLQKALSIKSTTDIRTIWPQLEVYFHGGINFAPYRSGFKKIFDGSNMTYMETYNASEGFFGIAEKLGSEDFVLLTNHAVWYEFIPLSELESHNPLVFGLQEVSCGIPYALCITTVGGLWRYLIGDVIEFTSLNPLRYRIKGRTSSYINIAGEELMESNAEKALELACLKIQAEISNYTVAPAHDHINGKTCHQWLIEFSQEPLSLENFCHELDQFLCQLNSDYEAKRNKDLLLTSPLITKAPKGSFYRWMSERKKLGGQNKVPRLRNDRKIIEEVIRIIQSENANFTQGS